MKKSLLLLFLFISKSIILLAQPEIISIVPSMFLKSQTVNIVIKGENTHFMQGITTIYAGKDISITSVNVSGPELLTATININASAKSGLYTIFITSSGEKIEVVDAIEILESGNEVSAVINLMPVSSLFLSDFDPNNIKNAPLIFTILVNNDQQQRNLNIVLSIFNEDYGKFLTADKKINNLMPSATTSFNNREFDNYGVSSSADKLFQLASQTGMMPPGNYRYLLEVFDENNNKLAEDEVIDFLSNDISDIELIGPGSELSLSPELITSFYPFFQWFSGANSFDLLIFEVLQGQKTVDEIQAGYRR